MDEIFSFSSNKHMGLGRDLALSSQCVFVSRPCNNDYSVEVVEAKYPVSSVSLTTKEQIGSRISVYSAERQTPFHHRLQMCMKVTS